MVRWLRRVRRLCASVLAAAGRASVSLPGGPDLLEIGADGSIRVTKPSGPAPLRPRVVANATFTAARTQRLARRAAAFLFDYYDFGAVPGQFWPIFEKSFDPGQAMQAFLLAVGCNPNLVRRRDPEELRKADEVIELLVRSGDILHRLPLEVRRIVSLQFKTGKYKDIRELAETAAHLQTALDYASVWTGKKVIASFAGLLRTIQRMLDDPRAVSAGDAGSAVTLVAHFSEAQSRFDRLAEQYTALVAALRDAWPESWRGTTREAGVQKHAADYHRVAESMRSSADLTLENLVEGNEFLANTIGALEAALEAAKDYGGEARDRAHRHHTAPPPDEMDVALRYFGFSKTAPPASKRDLRDVRNQKIKAHHPDAHPGASDEEIARLTDQCQQCERYYGMLLAYFSWR
jgi:hypothetical protein